MASNYNVNPLYIENATDGNTYSGGVRIDTILWVSNESSGKDIAADDDFKLVDSNNKTIVEKRAEAATDGLNLTFSSPFYVDGISVTKLTGGVCFIYLA